MGHWQFWFQTIYSVVVRLAECQNYKTLDSATRSAQFNASVSSCDDKLPRGWYRFSGAAGNTIPTSCVPTHHCGTHAPGWLSGPHPAAHEGKVRREVCFHWKSCCSWRNSVLVRNCGEFFVYDLSPTLTCNLRYCGKGPGIFFLKSSATVFTCVHKRIVLK